MYEDELLWTERFSRKHPNRLLLQMCVCMQIYLRAHPNATNNIPYVTSILQAEYDIQSAPPWHVRKDYKIGETRLMVERI